MDVFQKIVALEPGQSFLTTKEDEIDLAYWRLPVAELPGGLLVRRETWVPREVSLEQRAKFHNVTIERDDENNCYRFTKPSPQLDRDS